MSLQCGSKSKRQQLKRPREEHLRYIYYCSGFSKRKSLLLSIFVLLVGMGGAEDTRIFFLLFSLAARWGDDCI